MVTSISHSPAETLALGETWGKTVHEGLVIALCGDLGAGKTQLVKGLAVGLGITARVTSPTFALVNTYTGGRLTLFHLDFYRLEGHEKILSAGLEEYLHPHGVTVIEWAERWFSQKPRSKAPSPTMSSGRHSPRGVLDPAPIRWVEIEVISESDRHIRYEDFGA